MDIVPSGKIIQDGLRAYETAMQANIENMANANTTKTQSEQPYKAKRVYFESYLAENSLDSVRVSSKIDSSPGIQVYDPTHPHADSKGMLELPNVSLLKEKTEYLKASKAYSGLLAYFSNNVKLVSNLLNIMR